MRAVVFTAILSLGCAAQIPTSTQATDVPPKKWRDLDEKAGAELIQAWQDNPTAAEEKYKGQRFRLKVKVMDLQPLVTEISPVEKAPSVSSQFIDMKSEDLKKLVNRKVFVLEFGILEYVPGKYNGVRFGDGTIVSGPAD